MFLDTPESLTVYGFAGSKYEGLTHNYEGLTHNYEGLTQ
jgi:hypothetical protein